MFVFVVPHHVTQHSVLIWIGWWDRADLPLLTLRLAEKRRQGAAWELPLSGTWSVVGETGRAHHRVACRYQVRRFDNLTAGRRYRIELMTRGDRHPLETAEFATLPARLPEDRHVELDKARPFTVLFGSCYSAPHDTGGKVDASYQRLWASSRFRPDLKLLLGDQVYVDQPAPMFGRMSSADLRGWFIPKYRVTWAKLHWMLRHGGNYLTSDDHEFWNDYPERPNGFVWPGLYRSLRYRQDWQREALQHYWAIQQPVVRTILNIGDDLSVFIADTRINRSRGPDRIMAAPDFAKLIAWVRDLRSPGVLVLGQPLFAEPTSHAGPFGVTTADHNLPYFAQYWRLLNALRSARHDMLVLAGDVHFGRITHWRGRSTITEIVSSPMCVLEGAESVFVAPPPGGRWPPPDMDLPPGVRVRVHPARIKYRELIPRSVAGGTENHFMTLAFTRTPTAVRVHVRPWLLSRLPAEGLPPQPWTRVLDLT